jgi:hypothetical protein
LRNCVEKSYKQMKDELGWAGFMVRSDRAIRRHWTLVCCAFAFCWWHAASQARASERARARANRHATRGAEKNQPRQGAAAAGYARCAPG